MTTVFRDLTDSQRPDPLDRWRALLPSVQRTPVTYLLVALVILFRKGDATEVCVLYLPNYAVSLRCIGQALQRQNIELFELKSDADDFRDARR
jgi:hypothetical protein